MHSILSAAFPPSGEHICFFRKSGTLRLQEGYYYDPFLMLNMFSWDRWSSSGICSLSHTQKLLRLRCCAHVNILRTSTSRFPSDHIPVQLGLLAWLLVIQCRRPSIMIQLSLSLIRCIDLLCFPLQPLLELPEYQSSLTSSNCHQINRTNSIGHVRHVH